MKTAILVALSWQFSLKCKSDQKDAGDSFFGETRQDRKQKYRCDLRIRSYISSDVYPLLPSFQL